MKKILKIFPAILLALPFTMGCSEDNEGGTKTLQLSASEISVKERQTAVVVIQSGHSPFTVSASDDTVVEAVMEGGYTINITGLKKGSASVTVTDSRQQSLSIDVDVARDIVELELDGFGYLYMLPGETQEVRILSGNQPWSAASSDPSIASAHLSDSLVTVTSLAVGEAVVTVTDDENKTAQIEIKVVSAYDLVVSADELTVRNMDSGVIGILAGNGGYSVVSSNPAVAAVTLDGMDITVDGRAEGTAWVTVSDQEGETADIEVTVIKAQAAYLGTNNYITVPFVTRYAEEQPWIRNLRNFSMEAMVRIDEWTFLNTVMGLEGGFLLRLNSDKFNLSLWDTREVSSPEITYGRWYHVAMTFDGNGDDGLARLYVDGVETGSETVPGRNAVDLGYVGVTEPGFGEFFIGIACDSRRYLNGAVTQVRLWNKTLSPEEIQTVRGRAVPPGSDGLTAYWKLNEGGAVTVIEDYSGNGFHGTPQTAV